uniref:Uncharacterized protein n=1 Tax=Physcomitrium patens TaxID=3218 RepID=A0A2K1JH84_PHYPA|nr:hypothetical protein PHYPA_018320 [Physcomitrium patens]
MPRTQTRQEVEFHVDLDRFSSASPAIARPAALSTSKQTQYHSSRASWFKHIRTGNNNKV